MVASAFLPELWTEILIPVCAVVGIVFSLFQWFIVSRVKVSGDQGASSSSGGAKNGYGDYLIEEEEGVNDQSVVAKCAEIQTAISEGATSFLFTEYQYVGVFMVFFAAIIFVFLGSVEGFSTESKPCTYDSTKTCKPALATAAFSTIAFILGAVTSVLSGFLGMKIATYANARTTLEARKSVGKAFIVAFRSGAVMGFLLAASGLLVLYITINVFKIYYGDDWEGLFEAITGYGLGGSSMALFGRVGGGIYTKAADVGADLVGKIERNIPEDDPRNPAVIADNVGDNVGDIAGMGSDLFGSYAEASCAALVVASISSFGINHDFTAMCYPLLISSMGILVCLITTLFATDFFEIKAVKEIEPALKNQLIISTAIMTVGIAVVSWVGLPSSFTIFNFGTQKVVQNWQLFLCVCVGLWAGLIIGFVTEYYTSNAYSPVQDVADSCRTGAATNVIFGLALGYKSVIIPIFAIAISIFVSFSFAAMYGVAVAALGMLSTIATGLAIDAYGPISDNAGGIAEMAGMSHRIRERTDALDAAGNTTAAIGKGFAIGSAALVSLALFGAFVSRAGVHTVDVLTPKVIIGLLVGAMLPYWFSAMTMKSVGSAALKMVEEVRRQFNTIPGLMEGTAKPDYATCVKISTDASIKEMIPPGCLVMLTPLIVGFFFGVETLSGVLAGSLVSGVQIAISASNTGGAWDNAKKYIEAGVSEHAKSLGPKGSEPHKAAVIGDTIGDPLKDTSGPSLNILIKLMAVESLVFAPFFATHGGILFNHNLQQLPIVSHRQIPLQFKRNTHTGSELTSLLHLHPLLPQVGAFAYTLLKSPLISSPPPPNNAAPFLSHEAPLLPTQSPPEPTHFSAEIPPHPRHRRRPDLRLRDPAQIRVPQILRPQNRRPRLRQLRPIPLQNPNPPRPRPNHPLPLRLLLRRLLNRRPLLPQPPRPLRAAPRRRPPLHLHPLHRIRPPILPLPAPPPQHPLRRRPLRQRVPQNPLPQVLTERVRHPLHSPYVRTRERQALLVGPPFRLRQGQDRRRILSTREVRQVSQGVRERRLSDGGDELRGARQARRWVPVRDAYHGESVGEVWSRVFSN
ncbi:unnamed protein product [Brassica rapa subsp. trilocularis]